AGFQRTAIVGIEGRIPVKNKIVRIIQLSMEEDSCREISDIGHVRIYTTDRLGIPLIETVTYPDMKTPDEVAEAAHYIRFLTRSTGKVRTGIGAAREDVNVSIQGGTRVEIKGVAHISLIPELTHNEAFRQKSLLEIRKELLSRIPDRASWKIRSMVAGRDVFKNPPEIIRDALERKELLVAVNLPGFHGLLSFFNQPRRTFADEISDRLKVIAGIEKPNLMHSEEQKTESDPDPFQTVRHLLQAQEKDAQLLFWGPEADIQTGLETIAERCALAFTGVPNETRKSMPDGTTLFERVLPGPNRMYPDTDSAPVSIIQELIDRIQNRLPKGVDRRLQQLQEWRVPPDTFHYLLRNNLIPWVERIAADFKVTPKFTATLLAHRFKHLQGRVRPDRPFDFQRIYDLFAFIREQNLQLEILFDMLPVAYEHPDLDFSSVLADLHFSRRTPDHVFAHIPVLRRTFTEIRTSRDPHAGRRWMMKELRPLAAGNVALPELAAAISAGDDHDRSL
ncbi:MAG: Glu-tRNA(Gln) amidotransferase GatDE subunit E, partial [Desulfobacteraceae bacterium]